MKIIDIIRSVMPQGTVSRDRLDWALCPLWPPDLFAAVATIVERSGCYTLASMLGHGARADYLDEVDETAKAWCNPFSPPPSLEQLWGNLVRRHGDCTLADLPATPEATAVLLKLFAIADQVCFGIGWTADDNANVFVAMACSALLREHQSSLPRLPHMPHSLCALVPPEVAVVLPKTMTPGVGCTVRSLSHNLALLPGISQLKATWILADGREARRDEQDSPAPIRLLVVPYPFRVSEKCFVAADRPANEHAGYFELRQEWLRTQQDRDLTAVQFVDELLSPLLAAARAECGSKDIHGIVLPECALSEQLAAEVATLLANMDESVEFLISGILRTDSAPGKSRNLAKTFIIDRTGSSTGLIEHEQSKHHRWRLDNGQVNRYALNLDAKTSKWWENIDISRRELPVYAIRNGVSMAVLVCEDLARNDPAMPVIRAIGPNLVVALLMDGPQLAVRWPANYATVLAEDPGSAVLSLTCAGMVDRSNWAESRPVRSVGLWRDASPGGRARELNLPVDTYSLLLTLKANDEEQHTLDNRSDGKTTAVLTLSTVIPLHIATRPSWL